MAVPMPVGLAICMFASASGVGCGSRQRPVAEGSRIRDASGGRRRTQTASRRAGRVRGSLRITLVIVSTRATIVICGGQLTRMESGAEISTAGEISIRGRVVIVLETATRGSGRRCRAISGQACRRIAQASSEIEEARVRRLLPLAAVSVALDGHREKSRSISKTQACALTGR